VHLQLHSDNVLVANFARCGSSSAHLLVVLPSSKRQRHIAVEAVDLSQVALGANMPLVT